MKPPFQNAGYMNAQLNATIKLLTEAIIQKDQSIADMQKQLDKMMEELEEILAGGLGGTNHFLVHGDGGTEEDEEGGSQKSEAQE